MARKTVLLSNQMQNSNVNFLESFLAKLMWKELDINHTESQLTAST